MATAQHDLDEVLERSTAAFRAELASLLEQGVRLGEEPEQAGRRAAASLATGQRWAEEVGPFLDTDGARAMLGGVTKQAVSDRLRRGALLGLPLTSDGAGRGRIVYPVWQFDCLDGLREVLPVAGYDVDRPTSGWTIAAWLTAPDPRLEGLAPVDLLRAGTTGPVLRLAGEVAASLGIEERAAAAAMPLAG